MKTLYEAISLAWGAMAVLVWFEDDYSTLPTWARAAICVVSCYGFALFSHLAQKKKEQQ